MKTLLPIFLLLLLYSCNSNSNEKRTISTPSNFNKFFVINYEDLFNNKQVSYLSQIASGVEYIKLESKKDGMLGSYAKCFLTDSAIFINNYYQIYKFSLDGKFIKGIGSPGRGPGEIDLVRTMSVLPDLRTIVVQKNAERRLMYFSFDGGFKKSVKIPEYWNLKVLNDGNYVAYDPGSDGFEKYNFILTNEHGDSISTVKNYNTFKNPNLASGYGGMMVYNLFEPFYQFNNSYYFKTMYNDTVYSATSNKNKIEPCYYINMGKFKIPTELRVEATDIKNPLPDIKKRIKFYFCSVFETSNKIFITSGPFVGNKPRYLIYNKSTKNGNALINDLGETSTFINDWDGGADFFPLGNLNENQVYTFVNILDLKKKLEKNKSNPKSVKNPDDQIRLEKIVSDSEVTDNPIIMIVTLKSNN